MHYHQNESDICYNASLKAVKEQIFHFFQPYLFDPVLISVHAVKQIVHIKTHWS